VRAISKIIVHESASHWGDADVIRQWHVGSNKWSDIGYHYVILNGFRNPDKIYVAYDDGLVEKGRNVAKAGAHAKGANKDSIGICLIGFRMFTSNQLFHALPKLLKELCETYKLGIDDLYPHNFFTDTKSCPDIDFEQYKKFLKGVL
jgi:hypothetical protein